MSVFFSGEVLLQARCAGKGIDMEQKKGKGKVIGVIVLALIIALMGIVYFVSRPDTAEGGKNITIEVISADKSEKTYELSTDAEYLKQAMDEAEGLSYSGTESEYGIMITEVNGERAVYETDGAYWGLYVNGDYCQYGIDAQPVYDGDDFEIVYTDDYGK